MYKQIELPDSFWGCYPDFLENALGYVKRQNKPDVEKWKQAMRVMFRGKVKFTKATGLDVIVLPNHESKLRTQKFSKRITSLIDECFGYEFLRGEGHEIQIRSVFSQYNRAITELFGNEVRVFPHTEVSCNGLRAAYLGQEMSKFMDQGALHRFRTDLLALRDWFMHTPCYTEMYQDEDGDTVVSYIYAIQNPTFDGSSLLHNEDEPAILLKSQEKGYPESIYKGIYLFHGVPVPKTWITNPSTIDFNDLLKISNIDQRMAGFAIVGMDRVMEELGGEIVDEDPNPVTGTLWRVKILNNWGDLIVNYWLKVYEPPSDRWFWLYIGLESDMQEHTAKWANNKTYQLQRFPPEFQDLGDRT